MGAGAGSPKSGSWHGHRIVLLPTTQLGELALGLAVAFVGLVLVGTVVPRGGGLAVACGLLGGLLALVAVVREHERALSVYAALVPLALAIGFLVGELVGGAS